MQMYSLEIIDAFLHLVFSTVVGFVVGISLKMINPIKKKMINFRVPNQYTNLSTIIHTHCSIYLEGYEIP